MPALTEVWNESCGFWDSAVAPLLIRSLMVTSRASRSMIRAVLAVLVMASMIRTCDYCCLLPRLSPEGSKVPTVAAPKPSTWASALNDTACLFKPLKGPCIMADIFETRDHPGNAWSIIGCLCCYSRSNADASKHVTWLVKKTSCVGRMA